MVERIVKVAGSGWRPWAIGAAALSVGCAAVAFFWTRNALRAVPDALDEWWQHREKVRANGDKPSASDGHRSGSSLFV